MHELYFVGEQAMIINLTNPKITKKVLVLAATYLIFSCFQPTHALAENSSPKLDKRCAEIRNKVDAYLTKISKKRFSGAVLIDYKGKKILSKGYGDADRKKGINYTRNTISDIGSVTKQFTAAAILKLEMQGKLSTADKLSKYFSDLPQDKSNITLHEVLNMSAGLHTYSDTDGDFEAVTNKGFLDIAMNQKLLSKPGSHWEYSNTSYSLLALLIERVSGMSYETYLYENLFKPAGMQHTGYSRPQFKGSNVAVQHQNGLATGKPTEKPWQGDEPYLHLKGNGGILSTIEDLYKWHQALLSDEILSAKAKDKYFKPYIEAWGGRTNDSYAYGWFIRNTARNTQLVHHAGGNGAAFAYFYRFIDEDITFIIVSNDDDGFNPKIDEQIEGLIFDVNFKPLDKTGYISLNELVGEKTNIEKIISFVKKELSSSSPSGYNLSQRSINSFGYDFVRNNLLDDALKIFKFNVELFPKSPDVYDSYGETLIELGDIKAGLQAYEKALALDPSYGNSIYAQETIQKYKN